jgi:hypothetical protein
MGWQVVMARVTAWVPAPGEPEHPIEPPPPPVVSNDPPLPDYVPPPTNPQPGDPEVAPT